MDYELCKQLKDAGWPVLAGVGDSPLDMGILPPLEELIEVCDGLTEEPIRIYIGKSSYCRATADHEREGHIRQWQAGETPTIAVARLYLALKQTAQHEVEQS